MAQEDTKHLGNTNILKQHKEKHTRTGDIIATDAVKVQSHSDYEYEEEEERWGMFSRPHLGGSETVMLGWGEKASILFLEDQKATTWIKKKKKTAGKKPPLVMYVYVVMTENVFESECWSEWVFGSDADGKRKGVWEAGW